MFGFSNETTGQMLGWLADGRAAVAVNFVPVWLKSTGLLYFIFAGVGAAFIGTVYRMVFGKGGYLDSSTEAVSAWSSSASDAEWARLERNAREVDAKLASKKTKGGTGA